MGRKAWTTPRQQTWLTEQVPKYREAQAERSLKEFYSETTAAFFERFPFKLSETVSADGIQAADNEQDNGVDYTKAPDLQMAQRVCYHPP